MTELWWCDVCGAFHDAPNGDAPWRLPSKPVVVDVGDDLRTRVFDAIHLLDISVADLARLRGPLTGVERARVEAVIASINRSIAILDQTRERG